MNDKPRWLEKDEQELWQLILAAIRKLDRGMENTLQYGGELTMPEFSVLATLSDADNKEMRLRELCNILSWDRSRTSHQVTRMERRGLLSKCKSEGDARGVMVSMTDEGMRRMEASAPDHVESVRRLVFDHLKEEDVPSLKRFLEGILKVNNVPGFGEG
ncbi:MarR family winged helix-turn-helix transcriptional regulator [Corynebacterium sp. L4756]|uniref:MarR family winged helix-turn-helix transcriptional regulator n=1 Tax=unclassified Corynebacterium TaxID=2624378 RepID=UPI00374D6101